MEDGYNYGDRLSQFAWDGPRLCLLIASPFILKTVPVWMVNYMATLVITKMD